MTRNDKKAFTAWIDPDLARAIKTLAAEIGKPQQDVVSEGLNLVLLKYRKAKVQS